MPSSESHKRANKKYYANNQKYCKEYIKSRREINREYVQNLRKNSQCELCLEQHPACLDFHHIDSTTKYKSIATAVNDCSLDKLKKEIAKCRILCSNCHRKLHHSYLYE